MTFKECSFEQTIKQEKSGSPIPTATTSSKDPESPDEGGEEERELLRLMKAGECKQRFVGWENCTKAAEENKEDKPGGSFQLSSKVLQARFHQELEQVTEVVWVYLQCVV